MLLSTVLKEMQYPGYYHLINEKQFECLALIASTIKESNCVFLDSAKYVGEIAGSVSMVITTEEFRPILLSKPFGLCITDNPREVFFEIHNYLSYKDCYVRKTIKSIVGENCTISPLASIAKNNVIIGNNVTIEEFVVIRENTYIGNNCIIRSGCKIGGQGFEFKRTYEGITGIAHVGGVKIGDNVEIQYNSCVDKGIYPWDDTIIGDYCKVDNLVHIAHGVKIGSNVMVVANSGIGGRTIIKDNTWIGFGSTIRNGIIVGENARANIGSVVTKSINDDDSVTGNFAINHKRFLENLKKIVMEDQ